MDRRPAALGLGDHPHDLRQQGVRPDLVRAHDERPCHIQRARHDPVAGASGDRHRFARDQGFVDGGASFEDHPVDRSLVAGAYPQPVAHADVGDRNLRVGAVGRDPPGSLRRERDQGPDGAGRMVSRAQLQNLAEQHQDGDHRRRLEIDRGAAVHPQDGGREQAGRDHGDDTVEPGDANPHGDQGEHIEVTALQGRPGPFEEGPAGPERDGRGQEELDAIGSLPGDEMVQVKEMTAHLQNEHGHGQDQTDPEAPGQVDELRIRRILCGDRLRLQRHAADRAGAGGGSPDFGMHGAGEHRFGSHPRRTKALRKVSGAELAPHDRVTHRPLRWRAHAIRSRRAGERRYPCPGPARCLQDYDGRSAPCR